MKKIILISVASLFFNLFSLFGCRHEWVDATCTAPKCCTKCEATEGDPLGHNWNPATCVDPKTCTVCNTTEGKPVMHNWNPATCEVPKTCADCQATDGDPLGHSYPAEIFAMVDDGITLDVSTSNGLQLVRRCTACNEVESSLPLNFKKEDPTVMIHTTNDQYAFALSLEFIPAEPSKNISNGTFTFNSTEYILTLDNYVPSGSSVTGYIEGNDNCIAVVAPFIIDDATTIEEFQSASAYVQFYTKVSSPIYFDNNPSNSTVLTQYQVDAPVAGMLIAMQGHNAYPDLCNELMNITLQICSEVDPEVAFYVLHNAIERIEPDGMQALFTFDSDNSIFVHAFEEANGIVYFFITTH